MTQNLKTQYDAIVVGGGPGGSTAATLLAKAGKSVLLIEKDKFPRYRIGESLVPGKQTVLDAGIRSDLPEKERLALFSGHSLRAGLASSAEVDERYVQKQLGHASAEMTRRYQRRRDRFRVNLTKAAGL